MANNPGNNKERIAISPEAQREKPQEQKAEKQQLSKEVEQTSTRFMEGVGEVVESAEASSEKVSEQVSEKKSVGPATKFPGGAAQTTQTAIKPIKIPTIEAMRGQIAHEIEKQIKVLEKEAKKIMRDPKGFSPYSLNGVVTKIRELKEILEHLAYATVETLKGWWLKFVKNISI